MRVYALKFNYVWKNYKTLLLKENKYLFVAKTLRHNEITPKILFELLEINFLCYTIRCFILAGAINQTYKYWLQINIRYEFVQITSII